MNHLDRSISLPQRSLAPDVARGAMLLFIALANVHIFLYGHSVGVRGYPFAQDLLDRIVTVVQMCLVDGRAYPMFAALFGYGIVQLTSRRIATGQSHAEARSLVRRRGRWMLLFGLLHALLLFSGDILGQYGLLAIIFAGTVLATTNRTLLIMAGCWLLPVALFGSFMAVPMPGDATALMASSSISNPLAAAGTRVVEWLGLGLFQAFVLLIPALLIGVWAARHRVLDEPGKYRAILGYTAIGGIGITAAGGLPSALIAANIWANVDFLPLWSAGALHTVTGFAGGIGYAAAIGWCVTSMSKPPGTFITALAACGQRSGTCYLWQSLVFVFTLTAWGAGLGSQISVSGAAALAIATWTVGVIGADIMRRKGHRGPFEVALRRVTYGAPRGRLTSDAINQPAGRE